MSIKEQVFGVLADGTNVKIFTVSNGYCSFSAIDYGCCLTSLIVPDTNGKRDDIVVSFPLLQGYIVNWMSNGAILGRYANRISNAKFSIDDKTYELEKNGENGSCIHSGYNSYSRKIWETEIFETKTESSVIFRRISPDGEQGFPGNLEIEVKYTLTRNNEFYIDIQGISDKATPVNLINHTYYNLKGIGNGTIHDLLLKINSDKIVEVNDNNLPTGKLLNIIDTPLDFTKEKPFSEALKKYKKGIDRCFVLNNETDLVDVISVRDPKSGRQMKVATNQVGVQVYTPHYDEPLWGKYGIPAFDFGSFCLETEAFPDSVNQKNFPNTIIKPGETYHSITKFTFTW